MARQGPGRPAGRSLPLAPRQPLRSLRPPGAGSAARRRDPSEPVRRCGQRTPRPRRVRLPPGGDGRAEPGGDGTDRGKAPRVAHDHEGEVRQGAGLPAGAAAGAVAGRRRRSLPPPGPAEVRAAARGNERSRRRGSGDSVGCASRTRRNESRRGRGEGVGQPPRRRRPAALQGTGFGAALARRKGALTVRRPLRRAEGFGGPHFSPGAGRRSLRSRRSHSSSCRRREDIQLHRSGDADAPQGRVRDGRKTRQSETGGRHGAGAMEPRA
ncbi:MAG: hypothetical protein BWY99_02588 [Synergistetes bacterium ADurb.BinA166]|nr:MAG: hypothetical protein BWY99_02588 [Synergistetes bacterium ADurb.BinA166]